MTTDWDFEGRSVVPVERRNGRAPTRRRLAVTGEPPSETTDVIWPEANDHLIAVETYFRDRTPATTCIRRDMNYLFICYTNRCGSNFIASSLCSSGHLNLAGEFFNADAIISNCRNLGLASLAEYFNWLTYREGKNGYLVSKLSITHLEMLEEFEILDWIMDISRFIMIIRGDKLAQSISADLAQQTGRWTHDMPSQKRESELEFSRERLSGTIESIIAQNDGFSGFFERNRITPEIVVYEKFLSDPALTVSRLAERIGVPGLRHEAAKIKLQRQTGRINDAWRTRYMMP